MLYYPNSVPEQETFASDVTAVVFGDGAAAAECGADHILTCPLEESGSPEDFAKSYRRRDFKI